jgi:CDP-6-deoxy-D-xylo-4-hexulose-3-dehydrase
LGYNLKVTEMQAAVGVEQLKKLPDFTARRKENWTYLKNGLSDLSDKLILPEPAENADPSWFGFLITVKEGSGLSRNVIVRFLEDNKIQTRLLFSGNIIKQPCFDDIRDTGAYRVSGSLDNSDRISRDTFWIGVYPGMNKGKLDHMIEKIHEAVK